MANVIKNKKIHCTECDKLKSPTKDFYISKSDRYRYNQGRMPICKDCLFKLYEKLYNHYKEDNDKALYHICLMFDMYYSKDLVKSSYAQNNRSNDCIGLLRTYIKNINSLNQYDGMDSLDSDFVVLDINVLNELEEKYKNNNEKIEEVEKEEETFEITKKMRKRWGRIYSDEDVLELEEFYDGYYNSYNHENNLAKLDIIKELCTYKLIISKSMAGNPKEADYKRIREYAALISSKMDKANLNPNQQKVLGEADDDIFGMKLLQYEKNKPVPKKLKEYEDVDGFWRYILKHMIKPLAVSMGLGDGEYSLEDGDKDIKLNDKMNEALEESLIDEE